MATDRVLIVCCGAQGLGANDPRHVIADQRGPWADARSLVCEIEPVVASEDDWCLRDWSVEREEVEPGDDRAHGVRFVSRRFLVRLRYAIDPLMTADSAAVDPGEAGAYD